MPPEQRAIVEPEVKGTVPGDLDRIRLQPLHELLPGDLFRLMLLTAPVAGPVVGQLQQLSLIHISIQENARLRELLGLRSKRRDLTFESAKVTARSADNWRSTLTLRCV